jgi:hypothetical protein
MTLTQQLTVIIFADSSSHVTISGNTSILQAEDTQYVCTAGLANPEATLAWTVQDDDGEDVPYIVTEDDDNTSTITLLASDDDDKIHITCVAGNTVGQARHTRVVHIESKTILYVKYLFCNSAIIQSPHPT